MTPDLQRIVEALKACRERYKVRLGICLGTYHVWDIVENSSAFNGTLAECLAYIDARCAEAMVRAIREPGEAMIAAGWDPGAEEIWPAMCDAILGETRP